MRLYVAAAISLIATGCMKPADEIQYLCIDRRIEIILSGSDRNIQDLEREGLAFASENPQAPQVPFSHANSKWLAMKDLYRPGDSIRAYSTKGYNGKTTSTGYAISRDGCVLDAMALAFMDYPA